MEPRLENPRMQGRRVLVLDQAYRPLSVVPWEEAFTTLFSDEKASVVCYSSDGAVIGVHRDIRVPSIIKIGKMIKPHRQRIRFCRKNVMVGRDGGVCQYCGERFPTEKLNLDHVLPRALGGQTTWENVVASCISCNQKKGPRTPEQAGMKLLRKPARPSSIIETKVAADVTSVPLEWHDYWTGTIQK